VRFVVPSVVVLEPVIVTAVVDDDRGDLFLPSASSPQRSGELTFRQLLLTQGIRDSHR
jgi:hypothetical protein